MLTRDVLNVLIALAIVLLISCDHPDSTSQSGTTTNATASTRSAGSEATVQPPPPTGTTKSTSVSTSTQSSVVVITNYVTSQSLKETVTQSEIIVLGNVIGTGEVINTSRDTQDHTKPSRDSFHIAQVYHFQVQRYLKGSGPLVLNVAQAEGVIQSPQNGVTQADIDRAKATDDHVPFNTGTTYLLFLRRFPSSYPDYPNKDYYAGPSEPWRIALSADGKGVIEAPQEALLALRSDFIPDPDMPLLPQIEQVIRAEQAAKPAP